MALKGRLTKDQFGLTMPVTAAAYVEKPPYWRGANWYTFEYETAGDRFGDRARAAHSDRSIDRSAHICRI